MPKQARAYLPRTVQFLLPQSLAEQVETLAQVASVGSVREAEAAVGDLLGAALQLADCGRARGQAGCPGAERPSQRQTAHTAAARAKP